jgi:hypothetical protein
MSLSNPFLPPNPLYPRASGGAGAEGLKKQFLINPNPLYPRASGGAGAEGLKKQFLINRVEKAIPYQ